MMRPFLTYLQDWLKALSARADMIARVPAAFLLPLFAPEATGMRQTDVSDFRTFQSAQRDLMLAQTRATIDALLNRVAELRVYEADLRRVTDPHLGLPDPEPELTEAEAADVRRIALALAPTVAPESGEKVAAAA